MVKKDTAFLLTSLQGILLDVTEIVYSIVELAGESVADPVKFRDNLNMSAFIIDNTIVEAITAVLVMVTGLQAAGISLKASGAVVMEGTGIKEISMKIDEMNSPSPAIERGITIGKMAVILGKGGNLIANDVIKIKGMVEAADNNVTKALIEDI
jgi:hypothetical protein